MNSKKKSFFKNAENATAFLSHWVQEIQALNKTTYTNDFLQTSFGKTNVWMFNHHRTELDSIVIFPGTRTHSLFWDLDNQLAPLKNHYRVYLVDVNGQPNESDGYCPEMKNNDFGIWGTEVIQQLGLKHTHLAGASLGGIICLKTYLVSPQLIKSVFLLNPASFIRFSMSFKNLYANLLPVFFPNQKNVKKFLQLSVLNRDVQLISDKAYQLLVDFEVFALKNHKYKGAYPTPMKPEELKTISCPVYLLEGTKDTLFPYQKNITKAREMLKSVSDVVVMEGVGHGIEIHKESIAFISRKMA